MSSERSGSESVTKSRTPGPRPDDPPGRVSSNRPDGERADGIDHPTFAEIGLDRFAPYLMNRIATRWNANNQVALRELGLTTTQMRTLATLSIADSHSISELSALTVTEQSTLSRALDNMERGGLIRRTARSGDNRFVDIALTDEGRAVFDQIWPTMRGEYRNMLQGIGEEEYEQFLSTLHKILKNIKKTEF